MLLCPICNSTPSNEQPESGLHCFTTIFNCGCKITQSFKSSDFIYDQRCDEPQKINSLDVLFNPQNLKLIYAQEHLNTLIPKSIFLAGPTPRDKDTTSWRIEAINILENLDFKGNILIPELRDTFSENFEYSNQIEWEESALKKATVILFWIPRELVHLPGFTTNIEWGYWIATNPNKIILGSPVNTPKMDYINYYANKLMIPNMNNLEETIKKAMEKINEIK